MWIDARKSEPGYALVEVLVAIVVLTLAILPMVGMFEAALRAATTSGDYDRAQACANQKQKLEHAKSLPYKVVKAGPSGGVCEPSGFSYAVSTQFVDENLQNVGDDHGLMKVMVTVEWDGDSSYGVTGVGGWFPGRGRRPAVRVLHKRDRLFVDGYLRGRDRAGARYASRENRSRRERALTLTADVALRNRR